MSHEDFVIYEQAKKFKELGFDWKCYTFYHWDNWCGLSHSAICENHNMFEKCISAPTLAQAQKWLREKEKIYLFVTMENSEYYWYIGEEFSIGSYKTYESALSAGIDKALDIYKKFNSKV